MIFPPFAGTVGNNKDVSVLILLWVCFFFFFLTQADKQTLEPRRQEYLRQMSRSSFCPHNQNHHSKGKGGLQSEKKGSQMSINAAH